MSVKDWRPSKVSSLLKGEELKRFLEIRARYSGLEDPAALDIRWMTTIVDRLARLKPEDFEFPKWAVLHNRIADNRYLLRYEQTEILRQEKLISSADFTLGTDLLDLTINLSPVNAVLVIRPYLKVEGGLDGLIHYRASFAVDGETLVPEASVEEFLIGPDGYGVRKYLWSFANIIRGDALFRGEVYNQKTFTPSFYVDKDECGETLGLFVANGTRIAMKLFPAEGPHRPVKVTVGLVAARYTTKA